MYSKFVRLLLVLTLSLVVGLLTSVSAQSQTSLPTFEPYVGYQLLRSDVDVNRQFRLTDSDSHGINAALTGYLNDNVGITGELAANFEGGRNENSLVTAMGGLTYKARRDKRVQPFVRGLAGVARERVASNQLNFDFSDTGLAFAAGGGVDVRLGDSRVKWRVLQVDYLQTRFSGVPQHNLRAGMGLSF